MAMDYAEARRDVRCGSTTEVQREPQNVGFRGQSGSRFRAAGGLFIAEAVEKVGANDFGATFVPVSCA